MGNVVRDGTYERSRNGLVSGLETGRNGSYRRAACAVGANVTEFPAGIGHNYGLESVTTAQRNAHYG